MQINLFKATLSLRAGARLGCGLLRKLNRWNKRKRESRKSRHQEIPPALHPLMNYFSREKIKHKQSIPFRQFQKYIIQVSFHTSSFYWVHQKCYTAIFFPIDGGQSSGLLSSLLSFPAWLTEAGAHKRQGFSFQYSFCLRKDLQRGEMRGAFLNEQN